jgi:uncharacterized protein involved in exopolysaccharide biosynthesis
MLIGAVITVLPVMFDPPVYQASASFAAQGAEAGRSGLASLAGQFGVSLPTSNQSQSPEFYLKLLKSRVLLSAVARDSFAVDSKGKRVPFLDLFRVKGDSPQRREEEGVKLLMQIVTAGVDKPTGVVDLAVSTRWPNVSLGIVSALVGGVNTFNQRTRQSQALAERKFVEGRLAIASSELRVAEDRLARFLAANRQYQNSPELTFEHERLQRAVMLQQQIFTSLNQSYEEVRIREVRDTPVITIVEVPSVRTMPQPRGRTKRALMGLLLGALAGALSIFLSQLIARRRALGDTEATDFVEALKETGGPLLRPFRRFRRNSKSPLPQ